MRLESRGTYHLLYEDVHKHPKTKGLARRIARLLPNSNLPDRLLFRLCLSEVVAQLHKLCCWACRESESGEVGHLDPEEFGFIVGWTDPSTVDQLFDAWSESGFLDAREGSLFIHDWGIYASPLLKKRQHMRRLRAQSQPASPSGVQLNAVAVAEAPPNEPPDLRQSDPLVNQVEPQVASLWSTRGPPRGRATEIGNRNTEIEIPSLREGRAGARDTHAHEGRVSFSHTEIRASTGTCHGSRKPELPPTEPDQRVAAPPRARQSVRAAPAGVESPCDATPAFAAILEPLRAVSRSVATDHSPDQVQAVRGWFNRWTDHLRVRQLAEPTRTERATLARTWSEICKRHGDDQRAIAHVEKLIDAWFANHWGARTGFAVAAFCRAINELEMGLRAPPPTAPRSEVVNGVEVRLSGHRQVDNNRRAGAGALALLRSAQASKQAAGGLSDVR